MFYAIHSFLIFYEHGEFHNFQNFYIFFKTARLYTNVWENEANLRGKKYMDMVRRFLCATWKRPQPCIFKNIPDNWLCLRSMPSQKRRNFDILFRHVSHTHDTPNLSRIFTHFPDGIEILDKSRLQNKLLAFVYKKPFTEIFSHSAKHSPLTKTVTKKLACVAKKLCHAWGADAAWC